MENEVLKLAEQIRSDNLGKIELLKKVIEDAEATYAAAEQSTEDKPYYKSKGFWGGALSTIAGAAGLFGVVWTAQDASAIQALADNLVATITYGSASFSGLLALWGRAKAQGGLKFPWSK